MGNKLMWGEGRTPEGTASSGLTAPALFSFNISDRASGGKFRQTAAGPSAWAFLTPSAGGGAKGEECGKVEGVGDKTPNRHAAPFLKCGAIKNSNNRFRVCAKCAPSPRVAAADVKMPHQAGPRPGDTSGDSPDLNIQPSPLTFPAKLPPADAHLAQSRLRGSAANADKVAVVPSDAEAWPELSRLPQRGSGCRGQRRLVKPKGKRLSCHPRYGLLHAAHSGRFPTSGEPPRWGWRPNVGASGVRMGASRLPGAAWDLLLLPGASPQRRTRCTEYPRALGLCLTPSGGPRLIGPTG